MNQAIDVLREHRIPYEGSGHRHGREGWVQIDCPFCGPGSRKFHMGLNLAGGYVNCWKCGRHDLWETLELLTSLPRRDISKIAKRIRRDSSVPRKREERPPGQLIEPKGVGPLLPAHRRYIRKRGFDVEQIEQLWEVKGIGIASRLQWSLYLPMVHRGKQVSWTTRSIEDNGRRRYISASPEESAVPPKELLYGEDYVRHTIIVVEGPLDVWRIGPGAVAVSGANYTLAQVERIARYPKRVICFDQDAREIGEQLADDLSVFPGSTYMVWLDAKDPASAGKEIESLRKTFL